VREFLDRAAKKMTGEPMLVLDWPLCILAKCRACGARSEPMTRLARLYRAARCACCGSRRLTPLRIIHRITRESPLADRPVDTLGMPAQHLYTIEFSGTTNP
jgi:hypothetical protein